MESKLIYHMGIVKAHFAHNKKRIFYSTNVKVPKSMIDSKGFVRSKSVENWRNLNQQILHYKSKLDEAITKDLRENDSVDIDRIKSGLNQDLQIKQVIATTNKSKTKLSDMLLDFISNQPKMNRGLKWRYKLLLSILKNNDVESESVKMPYLYNVLEEFRNEVNANTGFTRYKNFKRFMMWCKDSGYPLPKIEWKRLSKPTFKPDFVFITDSRIDELINLHTLTDFEEKVRKIFLILIYTGMRYSDYISLTSTEMFDGYIDKVAKKTKTRFKVPIHENIASFINDPPKMASQTFNRGIQALGKRIGWTELIRYQKDINEFAMVPFHEMLCSSVGRHTFATRALLSGVPHNIIIGWCGWASSSLLFYYSEKLKLHTTDWMSKIK